MGEIPVVRLFWYVLAMAAVLLGSPRLSHASDQLRFSPNTVLVRISQGAGKPAFRAGELGLHDPVPVMPQLSRKPARSAAFEAGAEWFAYRLSGGLSPQDVADSLNRIPGIVAQPNYLYRMLATLPNDPEWQNQWAAQRIRVDVVWQQVRSEATKTPVIGIIDSGVDYNHPDLAGNIWRNTAELNGSAGIDDDQNGYVDDTVGWDFTDSPGISGLGDYLVRDNDPHDEMGHGTQVAGVAAAVMNNGIGIAGTAPNARIMCLRAGAQLISGSGYLEEDDIAAAVVYAVENGADIINMSFGDVVSTALLRDVTAFAHAAGVILVAAAGNENAPSLLFPAGYDETIAVGATGENDARASFSSYGENLDLSAPGVGIFTTNTGGTYRRNGGTSFSAPFVSGAAAVLLSRVPGLTPTEARAILCRGVVDLGAPGWDPETGHGRLDLPTLLGATSDPVASISVPARPAGSEAALPWALHARGVPPVAWTLSFGIGSTPRVWTIGASGVFGAPAQTSSGMLPAAELVDTVYCLRLTVSDALGRSSEDRTLFEVDRTPPTYVAQPVILPRWDDDRERVFLKWETDDVTEGTVRLWRGTATGSPAVEFATFSSDRAHFEEIPAAELGAGDFVAQVVARNSSGLERSSVHVPGRMEFYSLPRSGFEQADLLAGGVLMPAGEGLPPLPDLDGNGVPEIVVKLGSRAAYDTVSCFECIPGSPPVLKAECPVPMRPSAVADIDGNGKPDLVGFDYSNAAFRVRVAEIGQSAPWWERTGLVGPSVADLDGDGRLEVMALVDTNRALIHVYEADPGGSLALKSVLRSPVSGFGGRFGIWRAVGDFRGTGRKAIAAGTVGGAAVLFPCVGDDAFGMPEVINGEGDATRTFATGDVNADGREDFAVVRYTENTKFTTDVAAFRLDVYTGGSEPFFSREFHDPRLDGNGFTAGQMGSDRVLALAMPPGLYVVSPSGGGVDGFLWYGNAGNPCQPLIANVDGQGGNELVFQSDTGLGLLRSRSAPAAPEAPRNLSVQVEDSLSVLVSWSAEPGLRYRIWAAVDGESELVARTDLGHTLPPTTLTFAPPAPTEVRVAVQAVDPAIDDSLGGRSAVIAVKPHSGPRATEAIRVRPGTVDARFDLPLSSVETNERGFWIEAASGRTIPSSVVLDRSGSRVILTFPGGAVSETGALLAYDVRDTSGARGRGAVAVQFPTILDGGGLAFAVATGPATIRFGFDHPVVVASLLPDSASLLPAMPVARIDAADQEGRVFDLRLASNMAPSAVHLVRFRSIRRVNGEVFDASAVVSAETVAGAVPRVVAVLQVSATELQVVFSRAIDPEKAPQADVRITPRISVAETFAGGDPTVLIVKARPETPIGPWEETYILFARVAFEDGSSPLLDHVFVPLGERVSTGRLRSVEVTDATHLRLRFDLPLAIAGQPVAPIRVEPSVSVLSFSVADSAVDVTVAADTPIGSWGITYTVHVDGLMGANGERLDELFVVRLAPPSGLDSVRVFPQPFQPTRHQNLVFGGLPVGSSLRLFSLDGALVRSFDASETGGITWDGTSTGGAVVSSGVFFYVLDSPAGRKLGKIAVVR